MMLTALALMAALEFGYTDGTMIQYEVERKPQWSEVSQFYGTFEFGASTGPIFFETSIRTDMFPKELTQWTPTQVTFAIGGGVKFNGVTIGYEHSCFHPMIPYQPVLMWFEKQITPTWEGAYDRFYLRMELSSK